MCDKSKNLVSWLIFYMIYLSVDSAVVTFGKTKTYASSDQDKSSHFLSLLFSTCHYFCYVCFLLGFIYLASRTCQINFSHFCPQFLSSHVISQNGNHVIHWEPFQGYI